MTADSTRSPLADRWQDPSARLLQTRDLRIAELPFLAHVDLRLGPAEATRAPFPLPLDPNTVVERDSRSMLWLGPDEWLIVDVSGAEAIMRCLDVPADLVRGKVFNVGSDDQNHTLTQIAHLPRYRELRAALLSGYREARPLSQAHENLIAPQVPYLVEVFDKYFQTIEIIPYPIARRAIIARGKRSR